MQICKETIRQLLDHQLFFNF
ncbi:hypothetical protein [Bacteroides ovatus]